MDESGSREPELLAREQGLLPGTHRFSHQAMATVFGIFCAHEDQSYAAQAARAAFDLVDRIETELTRHRPSSDISRINRLGPGRSARVGSWTLECLLLARRFYQETGGAFDVSLGSGLESVEPDPAGSAVTVRAPGVRLDLGGIGKGYALDRAAELLEEWEVTRALLHAGFSSVLALEAPPGRAGWPVTISLPGAESARVIERFQARRAAWGASGIRKKDHILDPRTRTPVAERAAAWASGGLEALAAVAAAAGIAASPCAAADALSTAFMIMAPDEIAGFCRHHPGIEARILERADAPQLRRFGS